MKQLYHTKMTESEIYIAAKVVEQRKNISNLSISEFALICNASNAMISKYAKNCGFSGYKELKYYVKTQTFDSPITAYTTSSAELKIFNYFQSFNQKAFEELLELCKSCDKILLFGKGPSLGVCTYFVPRIRNAFASYVVCETDKQQMETELISLGSKLLIILSASGENKAIIPLCEEAKQKKVKIVIISENYNPILSKYADLTINLLNQGIDYDTNLMRGRSLFFIYLETLVQTQLNNDLII
ncbi:MAG: MurR/RpiR family transcriptional regulator [Mycoplasmatales bacterium]